MSAVGNGGVLLTTPSAPINLKEDVSQRTLNALGITWQLGASSGGTSIIDFKVFYDQGLGVWVAIAQGITSLAYVVNTLTPGVVYGFKV
jgi:hypothetical protein